MFLLAESFMLRTQTNNFLDVFHAKTLPPSLVLPTAQVPLVDPATLLAVTPYRYSVREKYYHAMRFFSLVILKQTLETKEILNTSCISY